ncbi:MAG TPA: VRR-NUC domain-containing protein [Polyangiaceae bacterium]|nr:VRR-NUC domain-containing protein [Polyangiaceae bacterium]
MTEHEEQVALMRLVDMHKGRWPELGMLFAVPNGGDRNPIVGKKLKAEGVRKGVPDLCLCLPRGGYHGLFIELKRQKKSQISPDQVRWISALREQGYRAEICLGAAAAWEVISDYMRG